MDCRAVLFDLDGTLLDTAPDLVAACRHTLEKYGIKDADEERIRAVLTSGMRAMMLSCIHPEDCHKYDVEGEMRKEFAAYYLGHINVHTRPFPGILELLDGLVKDGIEVGVITSKYENMAQKLLKEYPFYDHLALVLGCDSLERSKPDPLPLNTALKTLSLDASQAIYIGDHVNDILCANHANVLSALAEWGYGERECDFSPSRIDIRLREPLDLLDWLEKH